MNQVNDSLRRSTYSSRLSLLFVSRFAMKVLIVRTSSMGDLIHTWPAITELKENRPEAQISWLAEEGFVDIAELHPAVDEVIPIAWRRWRRSLMKRGTWNEMRVLRARLRSSRWDVVVDCQGLLKSALPARWAGARVAGYDRHSIREPAASVFYDDTYAVSWQLSAVDRCRQLLGGVFAYHVEGAPSFGITATARRAWLPPGRYVVLLHGTSKVSKEWPEGLWTEAACRLYSERRLVAVLPWGNERERLRAERLAAGIPHATVAPFMSLRDASGLLGHATAVIGVDTGLTHLANALDVPLVALYCDSDPRRTGVVETPRARNLGHRGVTPTVAAVLATFESVAHAPSTNRAAKWTHTTSSQLARFG